jgi:hypothetical protein
MKLHGRVGGGMGKREGGERQRKRKKDFLELIIKRRVFV